MTIQQELDVNAAQDRRRLVTTEGEVAPRLRVSSLVKAFGSSLAVNGVSFDVAAGECVALLGPSGCGKTTTLRCIAGLDDPTSGEIVIDGAPVWNTHGVAVPPERRPLGMMFQSYALWPHLTVRQNVEYPLKARSWPKGERADRIRWALELVGLSERWSSYPNELSGGQQQRVALARSIVAEPSILLFDEPLANLDRRLRESMRHELRSLIERVGITSIYVTHDQAEAFAVADRVAVMRDGVIEQMSSSTAIYNDPANLFVAEFVGHANVLDGMVEHGPTGDVVRAVVFGDVIVPGPPGAEVGTGVGLMIRPERVTLLHEPEPPRPGEIRFTARLTQVTFLGNVVDVTVEREGHTVRAALHASAFDDADPSWLRPGRDVCCAVRARDVKVLP